MKTSTETPDSEAEYQHVLRLGASGEVLESSGLSLESDAVAGVVIQRIEPVESKDFSIMAYVVDVQIRDTNGDVWTPVTQSDSVVADVTHVIEVEG